MITININGKDIQLEKPMTILEAAKLHGIKIPHFCHHPVLELWGGCRMCLVEVEKMPKLQTACTLYVTDGMIIRTESPQISLARKSVLEFLLINHPLDCPVCDRAGECKLQDYTMIYGPTAGRFGEGKLKNTESLKDPLIVRNPERCILCTRCVRMCEGVQGASAIAINNRGNKSVMEPLSGGKYDCEYCGNCLTVCPVGAVMSKLHRYGYRPWQIDKTVQTVCSYCGVGCTMFVEVRGNAIKRTTPKIALGSNRGLLCSRGRFGYEYVASQQRLTTPLVRKNGKLQPATWDEALDAAASRLLEVKNARGPKAIAGIASARCTNEDNFAFQKLLRGLGTENIDSIARMGYAGAQGILDGILGSGSTATPISNIQNSDAILVIESDPTRINPVLGIHIRMAAKTGAKVFTIGHAPGLSRHRTEGLSPAPGTEGVLLGGLVAAAVKGLPSRGTNPALEEKAASLSLPSPEEAERDCKLPQGAIGKLIEALKAASSVSIVIGRETAGHSDRTTLAAALAYLVDAKVYLMSERPNEQGLIDTGCTPGEGGLSLMEIMQGAASGDIKALYVMGENPAFNLPDCAMAAKALDGLEFLVVQDIFMTETAEKAHVVLPAMSWAQKEGSYTNLERRIQRLRNALNGQGMEDWKIVAEIGKRAGLSMFYESAADVMTEMARSVPLYKGLSYDDMEQGLSFWPYKAEAPKDGFIFPDFTLDRRTAPQGLGLIVEKPLFHSGTLSRMSPALLSIHPEAVVKINKKTSESLSVGDGATAKISSDKGSVKVKVKVDEEAPDSTLIMTNNFRGGGAFGLLGYRLDPVTKAPLLEAANVRMEAVEG